MRVGDVLLQRMDHVERPDHVVALRRDRVVPPGHRVRRGRLLGVVDHRVWEEAFYEVVDEAVVFGNVADRDPDLLARDLLEATHPVPQRRGEDERGAVHLGLPLPLRQVVRDQHLVAEVGEIHRGRPPEVAVSAENEDAHPRDCNNTFPCSEENSKAPV